MPKSIPLRRTLRIKRQRIIIHRPRLLMINILLECSSTETRHIWFIESPICRNSDPVDNFFGGSDGVGWCETVEHAELVAGAEEAPCVAPRTVFLQRKG